jgi:hypothetical protein
MVRAVWSRPLMRLTSEHLFTFWMSNVITAINTRKFAPDLLHIFNTGPHTFFQLNRTLLTFP